MHDDERTERQTVSRLPGWEREPASDDLLLRGLLRRLLERRYREGDDSDEEGGKPARRDS